MKFVPRFIGLFIISLLLTVTVSCNKDDNRTTPPDINEEEAPEEGNGEEQLPTIDELARSVADLSQLVTAIDAVDPSVGEALGTAGKKTVFAPSNAAFSNFLSQLDGFNSLADFDEAEEKQLLAEILKYHVVADEARLVEMLSNGLVMTTLQTETVSIQRDNDVYVQDKSMEGAKVTAADNEGSNGVVHIINKVLLPDIAINKLFPKPTLAAVVNQTDSLSLLKEALEKAGLTDTLNSDGPFTLFAPTNTAINQLFEILGEGYDSFDDFDNFLEIQVLEKILLYHLVPDKLEIADLSEGTRATLLNGNTLEIAASRDSFVVKDASGNDANIVSADHEASNGYVHQIDKILIPQELIDLVDDANSDASKTIKELVEESSELSFLKKALEITGLLEILGEEGPYTVFAPSNEVLTALFPFLGSSISSMEDFDNTREIALLRDVLLYHVLPGKLVASDFNVAFLETLSGSNTLELVARPTEFSLLDAIGFEANFLMNDISAKNGVVHTVDRVLVPSSVLNEMSVDAIRVMHGFLENRDDLSEVYKVFQMVGTNLSDLLDREFTFFFPSNQAFLDLFNSLPGYDSLADFNTAEELGLLVKILEYHCVEGTKLSVSELTDMQLLTSAQGEQLAVRIEDGLSILDKTGIPSRVTAPDQEILKGIIHVVDKVLLPQEILNELSS